MPGARIETAAVISKPRSDRAAAVVPQLLAWLHARGIATRLDRETAAYAGGGGFFDRTLAALEPRPLTVAHAFELSRIPTTYPQPHDVLMDFVVTEAGIQAAVPGGLEAVTAAQCRRRVEQLAARRGLPRHPAGRV